MDAGDDALALCGQGSEMSDRPRLEDALSKFETALNGLEAVMVRARESQNQTEALNGETTALREDRARLAEELDQVRANANRLLEANTQAETRISSAMERIKSVLGE